MQEKSGEKCSLVQRLDRLRVTLQLNWAEIAAKVGLSESMLYQVKAGKKNLSDKAVYRLEQAEREAGLLEPEERAVLEDLPEKVQKAFSDIYFNRLHEIISSLINESEALAEMILSQPNKEDVRRAAREVAGKARAAKWEWANTFDALKILEPRKQKK